ncbi:MAG: hypothetical protein IJS25_04215 [Bacteroidales bacterium]|nr:hypothetical protein [Bacteroidales bacterium]
MMKRIAAGFACWLCCLAVLTAQESAPIYYFSPVPVAADSLSTPELFRTFAEHASGGGAVTVVQDSKVERLLDAYRQRYDEATIPGYRIRIFSAAGNTARRQALDAMKAFSESYPDIVPYLSYDEPYFKIYVGDFRIKSDALRFQKQIAPDYPHAFISADNIRVRTDRENLILQP